MNELIVREVCSCGASIEAIGSRYRSLAGGGGNSSNARGAEEVVERWRKEHRHDIEVRHAEEGNHM